VCHSPHEAHQSDALEERKRSVQQIFLAAIGDLRSSMCCQRITRHVDVYKAHHRATDKVNTGYEQQKTFTVLTWFSYHD